MKPTFYYFVYNAELLEDGVLRIRTGGSDGNSLCDGYYDVSPDSSDYKFWLWLKERQKPRWFHFQGGSLGLDEQAITEFREEYNRKCT